MTTKNLFCSNIRHTQTWWWQGLHRDYIYTAAHLSLPQGVYCQRESPLLLPPPLQVFQPITTYQWQIWPLTCCRTLGKSPAWLCFPAGREALGDLATLHLARPSSKQVIQGDTRIWDFCKAASSPCSIMERYWSQPMDIWVTQGISSVAKYDGLVTAEFVGQKQWNCL